MKERKEREECWVGLGVEEEKGIGKKKKEEEEGLSFGF